MPTRRAGRSAGGGPARDETLVSLLTITRAKKTTSDRLVRSARTRAASRDVKTTSTGWTYTSLRTPLHARVVLFVSVKPIVNCPSMMPQPMDAPVTTVALVLRHRVSRT